MPFFILVDVIIVTLRLCLYVSAVKDRYRDKKQLLASCEIRGVTALP